MSVKSAGISILTLRNGLLAGWLVVVVTLILGVMTLVSVIFEKFGPAVHADLAWKAQIGARELAQVSDIGLAIGDPDMVSVRFKDYEASSDVISIVAKNIEGKEVVSYGESPWPKGALFSSAPGRVIEAPEYFLSWYTAESEDSPVGRIAVVISKSRLIDAQMLLWRIKLGIVFVGGLTMVVGLLVLGYCSHLVIKHDQQRTDYASMLEEKVASGTTELDRRNRDMRLVLDNVSQGFITIGLNGAMEEERSAVVDKWFPGIGNGVKIQDIFQAAGDHHTSDLIDIGLNQATDTSLTVESLVKELPPSVCLLSGQVLQLDYIPIMEREYVQKILLVLSDITEKLEREKAEAEQREVMGLFQRINKDKVGFFDFLKDARGMEAQIVDDNQLDSVTQKRLIYTLECNTAFYGLSTVSDLCHKIAEQLSESGGGLDDKQRSLLRSTWGDAEERITALVGEVDDDRVDIDRTEYRRLRRLVEEGADPSEIERVLRAWELDPVQKRLDSLKDQALAISTRLGKEDIEVRALGNGVRLDAERWAPLWSSMTHAVRNAIDHGLETPEERSACGKSNRGKLLLSAIQKGPSLAILVEDDGRGIDWDTIREQAAKAGLPNTDTQDIAQAIFADGISSKDTASEVSGQGMGMSVLREVVHSLRGRIDVQSELGRGTRLLFQFPNVEAMTMTIDLEVEQDTAYMAPVRASRRLADILREKPQIS